MRSVLFLGLILSLVSFNSFSATGSRVSKSLDITVEVPDLFGGNVVAQLYIKHNENPVIGPSELGRIVESVTYRDNKGNFKTFTPEDGNVVLIAREDLIEIITTDMLKAEVGTPYLKKNGHIKQDVYPMDLKFRSKILGKEFRQVELQMVRIHPEMNWVGQYEGKFFDAINLQISYSGNIKKIILSKKGKMVKVIYPTGLPEVSLNDF